MLEENHGTLLERITRAASNAFMSVTMGSAMRKSMGNTQLPARRKTIQVSKRNAEPCNPDCCVVTQVWCCGLAAVLCCGLAAVLRPGCCAVTWLMCYGLHDVL